jgi:hypothetical protein
VGDWKTNEGNLSGLREPWYQSVPPVNVQTEGCCCIRQCNVPGTIWRAISPNTQAMPYSFLRHRSSSRKRLVIPA